VGRDTAKTSTSQAAQTEVGWTRFSLSRDLGKKLSSRMVFKRTDSWNTQKEHLTLTPPSHFFTFLICPVGFKAIFEYIERDKYRIHAAVGGNLENVADHHGSVAGARNRTGC